MPVYNALLIDLPKEAAWIILHGDWYTFGWPESNFIGLIEAQVEGCFQPLQEQETSHRCSSHNVLIRRREAGL